MAIRNRKVNNETYNPSHSLVVTLTTKSGKQVRLGTMGLFENNNYHQTISEMADDELAMLNLSFSIEEYGAERTNSVTKDDLI